MGDNITIRPLVMADQDRISEIFSRVADTLNEDHIRTIISASSAIPEGEYNALTPEQKQAADNETTAKIIEIFLDLLKMSLMTFKKDVQEFFADLIGVSYEEYRTKPIDIDIQVIEALTAAPEVRNFFTGALRLVKVRKVYETIKKKVREKLGINLT